MTVRVGLSAAVLLTLSACATAPMPGPAGGPPPPPANAAFRTSDFAWSTAPGTATIDGNLAYKAYGKVHSCQAAGVILTPETPWVRSRMQILYNSMDHAALPAEEVRRRTPPERSQDYSQFVRRAACDASGHFVFTGLPDGAWYVITVARPQPAGSGPDIAVMERVTTSNGRVTKVKLG